MRRQSAAAARRTRRVSSFVSRPRPEAPFSSYHFCRRRRRRRQAASRRRAGRSARSSRQGSVAFRFPSSTRPAHRTARPVGRRPFVGAASSRRSAARPSGRRRSRRRRHRLRPATARRSGSARSLDVDPDGVGTDFDGASSTRHGRRTDRAPSHLARSRPAARSGGTPSGLRPAARLRPRCRAVSCTAARRATAARGASFPASCRRIFHLQSGRDRTAREGACNPHFPRAVRSSVGSTRVLRPFSSCLAGGRSFILRSR